MNISLLVLPNISLIYRQSLTRLYIGLYTKNAALLKESTNTSQNNSCSVVNIYIYKKAFRISSLE